MASSLGLHCWSMYYPLVSSQGTSRGKYPLVNFSSPELKPEGSFFLLLIEGRGQKHDLEGENLERLIDTKYIIN